MRPRSLRADLVLRSAVAERLLHEMHVRPREIEGMVTGRRESLVIFARVPQAGQVKTRLAAGIGNDAALSAYLLLADRVIGAVRQSAMYSITVAYTPESGEGVMREWLGATAELVPQTAGDLGARMAFAIAGAIGSGAERVVVIGTDCPDIDAAVIEDAFERLATADVVLGPASDGGYYLVGMSRLHARLFENVPWSSPDTLRITLEHAKELGLSVALLAERSDIDTASDWHAWLGRTRRVD